LFLVFVPYRTFYASAILNGGASGILMSSIFPQL
jgi:hypothetical protein